MNMEPTHHCERQHQWSELALGCFRHLPHSFTYSLFDLFVFHAFTETTWLVFVYELEQMQKYNPLVTYLLVFFRRMTNSFPSKFFNFQGTWREPQNNEETGVYYKQSELAKLLGKMLLLGWCLKRNSCYYCRLAASCPELWLCNTFLCPRVSLLHKACARGHSLTRGRAICFPSDPWTQGSLLSIAPPFALPLSLSGLYAKQLIYSRPME